MIIPKLGLLKLCILFEQKSWHCIRLFFLFTLLVNCIGLTYAQQTSVPLSIRVGVIPSENLFEEHQADKNGAVTYSGYFYDYLAEISKHTGWLYSFVKCDSTETLREKLRNDEIDIGCDPFTEENEETTASEFITYHAGTKCIGMYVPSNRPQVFLDGMNIGFVKNSGTLEKFEKYNEKFGYDYVPFIYENIANARQALKDNEIAALLTSNFQKTPSCDSIMVLSPQPFFFLLNTNITLRQDFRLAQRNIALEIPEFFDMLSQHYFGTDYEIVSELTAEEQTLLQSGGIRTVGLVNNSPPFSNWNPETQQIEGIFPQMIALLNKNNPSLRLRCVVFNSVEDSVKAFKNGKVNILLTANYMRGSGFLYTRPLLISHDSICGERNALQNKNPIITVYTDRINKIRYLQHNFPNMLIRRVSTQKEMYDSFIDGNTDLIMDIQLSVDYHSRSAILQKRLNVLLTTPIMQYFRLAIGPNEPPQMVTILNKCISSITNKTAAYIALDNTFNIKTQRTLYEFVHMYFTHIISALFFITITFLGFYIRHLLNRNKRQQQRLMTDFVLGIGNRLALSRKMDDLNEREAHGAMIMFGMNDFKSVNSAYGQSNGTAILQEVAKWLRENYGQDSVFRYGGDKFLVCAEDIDEEEAYDKALTIIERFSFPWFVRNVSYIGTISTVIILFDSKNEQSFKNITSEIDFSYTEAKRTAKPLVFCDSTVSSRFTRQVDIIEVLKNALSNDSFTLLVQPLFSVKKQKFCAGEILLRLNDKRLGNISPGEFIPIAEHTGLINPIGLMLIDKACKQMREWIDAGIDIDRLNINVSVIQLMQIDFVNKTLEILNKYHLPMHSLCMEITESVLADSPAHMVEVLCELQDGGIRFAIDDFGTEYSSFSMLHQLPASSIKLDKTFIQKLDNHQRIKPMIKGIINMAHELGLAVISEGVENKKQRDFLVNECGTDLIQGFYYSEPIPFYQYEHILRMQDEKQFEITH